MLEMHFPSARGFSASALGTGASPAAPPSDQQGERGKGDVALPPLPVPPREPEPGECCGNGCANCVFVDYWEQLTEYNIALEHYEAALRERDEVSLFLLVALLVG